MLGVLCKLAELHITIFFRHPRPEYNSIEEVFMTTLQAFPKDVTFDRHDLPHTGAGAKAIVGNMIYAWRHRGLINHITGDVHYIALATGRNTVLTIHDVHSILRGPFFKRFIVKILWFWMPALLVKKITTVSPKTQSELASIVPFAKKKICIVANPYNPKVGDGQWTVGSRQLAVGSGPSFVKASAGEEKRVVFLVGTKVNKNLERTIEALRTLDIKLIVLGKLSSSQIHQLNKCGLSYENYFNIPFTTVASLYRRSDLVCFASLYEGFGMPVLEAQLSGKPVVTSYIEPLNWVAGDGALLVDPLDTLSIREGVTKLLRDSSLCQELINKGMKNVSRFAPKRIAETYQEIYISMKAVGKIGNKN